MSDRPDFHDYLRYNRRRNYLVLDGKWVTRFPKTLNGRHGASQMAKNIPGSVVLNDLSLDEAVQRLDAVWAQTEAVA